MTIGMAGAVDDGLAAVNPEPDAEEVKKLVDEYTEARAFDEFARKQYNVDRKYAQGVADPTWASDANLIGAFIDILVSFLFAKNPDVGAKPSPQAGGQPDEKMHLFSETMQIVVSRLWKDAKLKRSMKRVVRSVLSVGVGWFKVIMYTEKKRVPQIEKQMSDTLDNIAQIEAIKAKLAEEGSAVDDYDAQIKEMQRLMEGLEAKVEIIVKRGLCIDFCRAEDIQVSLDVSETADHLDADWNSNDMYVRKTAVKARFPDLLAEDIKSATIYHQRQSGPSNGGAEGASTADAEGQFTKSASGGVQSTNGKAIEFVKVVELWDRRDNLIKTFIEGVTKKWAVVPYAPPQASERFYPYFRIAFFETDGSRHPQSLSWRLRKLQDEYSSTRSAGLTTKQRSVPGTVFNVGQLSTEDVQKLQNSSSMEYVGLNPTSPDIALDKLIAPKPVPSVNPSMYDTQPCQRDMEVLSGVQEALSSGSVQPKTATEADIQQEGFSARTSADRDDIEETLNDLAIYTAQLAIQSIDVTTAQRYAGPLAFWPYGMDVQDVLSMLQIEIEAGTTGKPQQNADKETWATLLPLIQQMMANIQQLDLTNPPLAKAYRNLLRETLRRLDDRLNIDSIMPPPPPATPGLGQPGMPGMPGAAGAVPGGEGGVPAGTPAGAPPVGNGTVNNPAALAPPPQ
jgi:hypothetical protein